MNCERCGRELKTDRSKELGFGPVCYKKHMQALAEAEFEKNQVTIDDVIEGETA